MDARPNYLRPTNADAPWARGFWEGLAEERFRVQRCEACGEHFFPPRPRCPRCSGKGLAWVDHPARGTLHSWTRVHVASPEFDTPFYLGLVDLEQGIGRLTARIPDATPERLAIDAPVRIGFLRPAGQLAIYCAYLD